MTEWSLYLVRMKGGQLYTGITTDVARRFAEHQGGGARAARALRGKGPLSLAFQAVVGARGQALSLEYRVKALPKRQKEALIAGTLRLDDIKKPA
ncbi:GIY-YIG nuclease family protein [Gallaecimonas sp. GXIMD4217]|uniref:GIY-YIG nuclease family protein n=1 Tax=Gallaecimonas sp. GXIMD4217 TaxID=3131927 RepID=UPI00311AD086